MSWNRKFDRKPALIVRCQSTDDVVRAVKAAAQYNLPIAVRSGGHSPAGFSTIDGGILIDLSLMKDMTIDLDRRVATAQPGLTWREYSTQATQYGLGTPAGDTATVGVGGLTLGGGIGWLVRKYGMTIDHMLSAEVVTAKGEVVTASETENPDLFWALRGGGGNFGIVTRFEFGLVPVGNVLGGMLVYPADPEVLTAVAKAAAEAPDELTVISMVMKTPPIPFLPPDLYGKLHYHVVVCYAGDQAEGAKALEPLRSCGPVLGQMLAPMPYPGMFKFNEEAEAGFPCSMRSHFLDTMDVDAAAIIIEHAERCTSPFGMVQIRVLGGALARVANDATAFAHRNAGILVGIINPWEGGDAEQAKQHQAWTEELWKALKPKSDGAYVNFCGDDNSKEYANSTYPSATYERLASIKTRWDPDNLFCANCNILPGSLKGTV
jgi:FAD/FMN-containing dehydrogenase